MKITSSEDEAIKKEKLVRLIRDKFKFRLVPQQDIEKMISFCRFVSYPKGAYIHMNEGRLEYLYFILSGSVEIYLLTNKMTKKIMSTLNPGDDFSVPDIIMACHLQPKNVGFYQCLEDCEVGQIPVTDFMEHCFTIRSINFAYAEMMAMIIQEMSNEILLSTAESKVASLLCYLSQPASSSGASVASIKRSFTMQKIADILNLARENTHRILADFEHRGIITMTKDNIVINDREKLGDLSDNMNTMMGFYGMLDE